MAVRDPETGRFVAGPDGADVAYSDLDVQHVVATLDDPDASHSDFLEVFENLVAFEPLGGLAREEVAELVAMYTQAQVGYTTAGGPEVSQAELTHELSFDSTPGLVNIEADDVTETDVQGITGFDLREINTVDIDILDHGRMTAHDSFEDETNGAGGSGDSNHLQRWVPYRAAFGRGPVVDRHDELHIHAGFNETGDAGAIEWRYYVQLIWDVQERE